MLQVIGGHRPRRIQFDGWQTLDAWTIKHYAISVDADGPRPALLDATRRCATEVFRAVSETAHPYGFTVAHDAGDFCFALVAWWHGENELHQRVFSAALDAPGELRPHPTPAIGCIWELAVHDFERRAWIEHMLAEPDGPRPNAYTDATFEGTI